MNKASKERNGGTFLIIEICKAVVYTGFRGWGGGPGSNGGGVLFYIGEIKNFAFYQTENFQKMFKNQ